MGVDKLGTHHKINARPLWNLHWASVSSHDPHKPTGLWAQWQETCLFSEFLAPSTKIGIMGIQSKQIAVEWINGLKNG